MDFNPVHCVCVCVCMSLLILRLILRSRNILHFIVNCCISITILCYQIAFCQLFFDIISIGLNIRLHFPELFFNDKTTKKPANLIVIHLKWVISFCSFCWQTFRNTHLCFGKCLKICIKLELKWESKWASKWASKIKMSIKIAYQG